MFKKLESEIIVAMKTRNKERLGSLKVFKSDILKYKIDNKIEEVTDEIVLNIANLIAKAMSKSLEIVEDEKNRMLLNVVTEFMPEEISEDEIKIILLEVIAKNPELAMGMIIKEFKTLDIIKNKTVDYKKVSSILKNLK